LICLAVCSRLRYETLSKAIVKYVGIQSESYLEFVKIKVEKRKTKDEGLETEAGTDLEPEPVPNHAAEKYFAAYPGDPDWQSVRGNIYISG